MFTGFAILQGNPRCWGTIFVLHGIVAGGYITLGASLGARIFPGELFAQFASANSIVSSVCMMVMGALLGKTLDILQDYRYVFLIGGIIAIISVLLYTKVYRNYLEQGGDRDYQAPMPR